MTRAEQEKLYFDQGKQVLGKNAGGLLTTLLKAKMQNIDDAIKVISAAALAVDPREYVAAACQYVPHPHPQTRQPVSSTLRQKMEIAKSSGRFYAHYSSRQWLEWDKYLKSQGKSGAIRDRDGGWWFATEWPPGHVGAAA
jgi:hypothetical protein